MSGELPNRLDIGYWDGKIKTVRLPFPKTVGLIDAPAYKGAPHIIALHVTDGFYTIQLPLPTRVAVHLRDELAHLLTAEDEMAAKVD